ncbi:molybdopterin cofactor-binding domain-containing protein [Novosphingobium sp.]|uniref:xanthine dehydrogenase family protein molybdopterin-binding subunit n=1 Tax=Novosphingobium sp. TaxID=1874826 RepID=UPI003D14DBFF
MSAGSNFAATRRQVLAGSGAVSLVIPMTLGAVRARAADAVAGPALAATGWLGVDSQGRVTLALPKTEMGQGILTTVTMIAAEELAVKPEDVIVSIPDGDAARFKPVDQGTGGSTSVRDLWLPLRNAGATARVALVTAGAKQWGVPVTECDAHDGAVVHTASGKVLPYAALVAAAAAAPLPTIALVRPASAYSVIGKSHRRLDGAAKARGTAEYGIDVFVPGMKFAGIQVSPVFGGKLASVDEAAARKIAGVTGLIRGDDVVYILGDNTWAVRQGLAAANVQWTAKPELSGAQHAQIIGAITAALDKPGFVAATSGDLEASRKGAAHRFSATYTQPFLAHATMEPANCVAHVHDGQCTIWTGTQIPSDARKAAATRLGLPIEKVTVHNRLMGGGFGRRLEADMVERCVDLAKQVPFPVKLIWTREEDTAHDWYRPAYADHIDIAVGADGKIAAWEHKIAGSSIMARLMGGAFKGIDEDAVEGAITPIYPAAARKVTFQQAESLVPTSWWRGVGPLRSAFVMECAVDELAHSLNADPIAWRLAHIDDPRARAVLEKARDQSGWAEKPAAGTGRGVAVIHLWETYMAAVAEIAVDKDHQITVKRVTVAVDCGQAINPSGVMAQIDSGVIFGSSAALYGEITIANGQVEQSNYNDYRVLRMSEAPVIHTTIIENHEKPGGMGEPPNAVIFPALANAVFAATGKRVRALPLQKGLLASNAG